MGCSRGAYGYLVAIICLTVNVVVEAGQYTFTKIADSSGNLFVDLDQAASINNQGTVTFVGDKADGTIGIYTWSNGLITPVIDNSGPISAFKAPVINNNGLIAFRGTRKTGGDAIYTVTSDGVLTPVAEASGNLILQGTPALNDAGNVVFAATDNGVNSILSGNGGALSTFVAQGGSEGIVTIGSKLSINSSGVVAFTSQTSAGTAAVFTHAPGQNGSTLIADSSGSFLFFNNPSINDSGTVAFDAATNSSRGIYVRAPGQPLTTYTDTNSGFQFVSAPTLNNSGEVFYEGNVSNNLNTFFAFDGPSPTNGVIPHTLFGLPATQLSFGYDLLNDSGQVVFGYELNSGDFGVGLASPVPEPAFAVGAVLATVLLWRRRSVGLLSAIGRSAMG